MYEDSCEGCRDFDDVRFKCSISEIKLRFECPCQNCLLKNICTEVCDDFMDIIARENQNE